MGAWQRSARAPSERPTASRLTIVLVACSKPSSQVAPVASASVAPASVSAIPSASAAPSASASAAASASAVPAVAWLYWTGASGWGTFLAVWTILVAPIDNVLRPLLIRRGVDLPLLLVFSGVVGGLIAFGPVGIFIGPVVLAVSSTLASAWIESGLAPLREAAPPEQALPGDSSLPP